MGSISRQTLREEAKRVYKEKSKGVAIFTIIG